MLSTPAAEADSDVLVVVAASTEPVDSTDGIEIPIDELTSVYAPPQPPADPFPKAATAQGIRRDLLAGAGSDGAPFQALPPPTGEQVRRPHTPGGSDVRIAIRN